MPAALARFDVGGASLDPWTVSAFPPVRIVRGAAFELIAQLAAFTSGPARASLDSGKTWIRDVRAAAGPELVGRVERYGLTVYGELATIALEAPEPRGVAELIRGLEAIDAVAFRRRVLGTESRMALSMVSPGTFDRALSGDRAAIAELHRLVKGDRVGRRSIDRLLELDPVTFRDEVLGIVRDWAEFVFPRLIEAAAAPIERDVSTRVAALAAGADDPDAAGRAAVASATRGVTYEPPDWIASIAIVPVVAIRPFVIPLEFHETAVFLVPVADEAFETDPAAPPRQLVKIAAAMGDELRLRALRLLRDDELTASEIAARLGVDRTSMHHHLGILRSAGLLAIHDEGVRGWRYRLREESFRGIAASLDAYLGSEPE
jgi:DNA-binding transcriptional ArsR family regulator